MSLFAHTVRLATRGIRCHSLGHLLVGFASLVLIPLTACLAIPAGSARLFAEEPGAPNIVLIMSDDMGYSDLGCYGGEIQTARLDRLAENGLRFTQFYNTARCCPTRASLLTGLYPHQTGIGWMMTDQGHPGYRGDLNRQCVTIAQVLGQAGYRCYMAGKWHVTPHTAPDGPRDNWPLQRGFDRFYGTIHGAGSFYDPNSLTRDNTQISPYADPEYPESAFLSGKYYYTDAISDHAVRFVAEHQENHPNQPFFMYVAYTSPHWPMHALEEDIAKYQGVYDEGYGPIRAARFERMKRLGVISEETELSAPPRDWSDVRFPEWERRNMEVYAAMIHNMDQGIGRIVDRLEADDQLDNTLILFLHDNGGCAENLGRQRRGDLARRPEAPTLDPMPPETLQKQMIPAQTRDGFPIVMGPGILAGPADTYTAYGQSWANVSNTPLREYKHWVHEGGISSPLIVHWPERVKDRGQLRHQPAHLIDIMASCVEVAAATYPERFEEEKITPLAGKSLLTAWVDNTPIEREAIFWEHEGNRAVRMGDWKLVAKGEQGAWELYDIGSDRAEQYDLAGENPDRVAEMNKMWQAWAERSQVLPLGAWRGNIPVE